MPKKRSWRRVDFRTLLTPAWERRAPAPSAPARVFSVVVHKIPPHSRSRPPALQGRRGHRACRAGHTRFTRNKQPLPSLFTRSPSPLLPSLRLFTFSHSLPSPLHPVSSSPAALLLPRFPPHLVSLRNSSHPPLIQPRSLLSFPRALNTRCPFTFASTNTLEHHHLSTLPSSPIRFSPTRRCPNRIPCSNGLPRPRLRTLPPPTHFCVKHWIGNSTRYCITYQSHDSTSPTQITLITQ